MLAVAALAVAIGVYYAVFVRNQVTTDDAYVNGNLVRLTPQIAGTVIAINTDETQYVRRGTGTGRARSRATRRSHWLRPRPVSARRCVKSRSCSPRSGAMPRWSLPSRLS